MDLNQPEQEQHTLFLEKTHDNGEEEWYCPDCGRRLLLRWPPEYQKTVLQPGDESAIHNASKGGLKMGAAKVTQEPVLTPEDEERLSQWEVWIDRLDFSGLAGLSGSTD